MTRADNLAPDPFYRSLELLRHAARLSPPLSEATGVIEREVEALRTIVRSLARDNPPDPLPWMLHSFADDAYWRAFEEIGAGPPEPQENASGPAQEVSDA